MHQIITAQSIDDPLRLMMRERERKHFNSVYSFAVLICSLPVLSMVVVVVFVVVSCACSMGCEIWHLIENYFSLSLAPASQYRVHHFESGDYLFQSAALKYVQIESVVPFCWGNF
jgi:hypothetical protein